MQTLKAETDRHHDHFKPNSSCYSCYATVGSCPGQCLVRSNTFTIATGGSCQEDVLPQLRKSSDMEKTESWVDAAPGGKEGPDMSLGWVQTGMRNGRASPVARIHCGGQERIMPGALPWQGLMRS